MKGKVIPLEMFAKKKKYCDVVIPNDENQILKHNHDEKLIKAPFVVYAYFETYLTKKLSRGMIIYKHLTKWK